MSEAVSEFSVLLVDQIRIFNHLVLTLKYKPTHR